MELSKSDRLILNSYKLLLDGLAEYLGSGYEIVLHSLEDYEHSAIKILNGHFTGRKEGAPITDLAVQMLAEIRNSGDIHQYKVYAHHNAKGIPMYSATLPIIGENNRIIGLLCMNFHTEISLCDMLHGFLNHNNDKKNDLLVETYTNNSNEMIATAVSSAQLEVSNNPSITAPNRNKEIIYILNEKGIFQLKDAVVQVAHYLGITKNTVYLHLRNLSNNGVGNDEIKKV